MKYILTLLVLFFSFSCTRTIEYDRDGFIATKEVKYSDIESEKTIIVKKTFVQNITVTENCSKMGICCKCGLTMEMNHECSCGVWRNCPGSVNNNYDVFEVIIYTQFNLKTEVLKSLPQTKQVREIKTRGVCQ